MVSGLDEALLSSFDTRASTSQTLALTTPENVHFPQGSLMDREAIEATNGDSQVGNIAFPTGIPRDNIPTGEAWAEMRKRTGGTHRRAPTAS